VVFPKSLTQAPKFLEINCDLRKNVFIEILHQKILREEKFEMKIFRLISFGEIEIFRRFAEYTIKINE